MPHLIHLRKEVLDWVLPRRRPLEALRIHDLAVSHDLDECDVQFLTQLSHDAATSKLFWCMALLVEPIVGFGSHLSRWLHKCPCGCDVKDKCVLKGRRSIELACGKIDEFVGTLKNLTLSPFAIEAHKELKWQDGSVATQLLNEYETAKGKVHVRICQSFSFWKEKPWNILRVGECLLGDAARLMPWP